MKVAVIGAGYAGLTLACLADKGHDVTFVDLKEERVEQINRGIPPIYEPGLAEILERNVGKRIRATRYYSDILECEVIFICVPTPARKNGAINLGYVLSAATMIAHQLDRMRNFVVIAIKSTVIPGTALLVSELIADLSGRKHGEHFSVCSNPEFLREGSAIEDFLNPNKIVIGSMHSRATNMMLKLYEWVDPKVPRIVTDPNTAEMIKYAQNAALAMKISFINEIANICEKFHVDVREVAHAIGLDPRIGPRFLNAGIGFGGSCLGKDLSAIIKASEAMGYEANLLKSVLELNQRQPLRLIELLRHFIKDIKGKTIAVLGLAFKPNTDDVRDSPAIKVINALLKEGAIVKAYDPAAIPNAKKVIRGKVKYCSSALECLEEADACLIATDWYEFKDLPYHKFGIPVVDGRRVVSEEEIKKLGRLYKGIGWKYNE